MANPKHPTARLPEPGPGHVTTVLLDVDGTLVDSNDAHALAWVRAFAEEGVDVPFEAVRRLIGMGGDKLMPRVSPFTDDSEEGKRVATRRQEIFAREFLPRLQPFRDAGRLVAELKRRGLTAVAASSAKAEELRPLLRIAERRGAARWRNLQQRRRRIEAKPGHRPRSAGAGARRGE